MKKKIVVLLACAALYASLTGTAFAFDLPAPTPGETRPTTDSSGSLQFEIGSSTAPDPEGPGTTPPDVPGTVPGISGSSSDKEDKDSSSSSKGNSVSVSKTSNGTVKVNPSKAEEGDKVTITVTPKTGYELDDLTVTDKNGNEISVNEIGNNRYTFTMPDTRVTVNATFAQIVPDTTSSSAMWTSNSRFADVPGSAFYYDAVQWAVAQGITSGTSANAFSPEAPCTRAQIVTFLWRAAGSPATSGSNPFADVSANDYYYNAVQWAVAQGITSGTSANAFSPDAPCTRAQAVTFLHRAKGSPAASGVNNFADVAGNAYYANAVQWAVNNSVTAGTSATAFAPDTTCTRAQIVTFMFRAQ